MKKKSQTEQIRLHLEKGGKITALEALSCYGCLRLSGRIFDLRKEGMNINSTMVERKGKHVAEYSQA